MLRFAAPLLIASLACVAQDFADLSVVKVLAGYRFTASPVWSREGFWLFSDAPANHVMHLTPGQKPEVFLEEAPGASGVALDPQGRVYVCESRSRRVVRIDKKKHVEPLAEKWQGKRLNAPNEIAVRKDNNAYFTDPAFGYQQDSRELDFFGVYRVTPKGELDLVSKSATRPNGIALAPNGRTLYVSDSDRRLVRVWDLDRSGAPSNERSFVTGIDGVPNGICVDEKGNLYVTANGLDVFSPEGKRLRHIEIARASSCGFGDPDLQSLYIAAGPAVYRIRLNVKGALQY